ITFCGEVTAVNRREAFESFDTLAVPSVWFETGPLVVLEAFAAGIPVVGSNIGGISELVTDGASGMLVEAANVNAWAKALGVLHRRKAERWNWQIPEIRTTGQVAADM